MRALEKTAAWHSERRTGIGASDAGKIMAGDWTELWAEKTGKKEPEDLSDVLAVQMGTTTEPLNRHWFAKHTSFEIVEDKTRRIHPALPFVQCELDGLVGKNVFEAKHVSAFSKPEEIVSRYYWNCQHQMAVTGANIVYLSVFFGNSKWEYFEVPRDEAAISDLLEREVKFWGYVTRNEEPPTVAACAKVEINFDNMREVDMTGSNAWASAAADWTGNKDAAKTFDGAAKTLKELMESDVKLAFGSGVKVTRAKTGALTVRTQ